MYIHSTPGETPTVLSYVRSYTQSFYICHTETLLSLGMTKNYSRKYPTKRSFLSIIHISPVTGFDIDVATHYSCTMFFTVQPLDCVSITIVIVFLVPICIIDWRSFLIPDFLVLSGCIALFSYLIFFQEERLIAAVVHGALGFAILFAFWFLFKKQVGLGDAKLSFFLAAGLGFIEWWGTLFIASLFAASYGLIRIRMRKMTMKDKLPLAPFFGIGVVCVLLFKIFILNMFE